MTGALLFALALAQASAPPSEEPVPSPKGMTVLEAIGNEARRYAQDSVALVKAPFSWDEKDRANFVWYAVVVGGLFLADQDIDGAMQNNRSHFTNRVSGATSWFGSGYSYVVSGAMIAGGLALRDPNLRDMGRDSLEAQVMAGLQTTILKEVTGRVRPNASDGETIFRPFSGNTSFPSGHATNAWAIASVVAMRADGWIIPSLAYAMATVVAFDRMNDEAHFASDVFTGAAIGLATGRFLVARHRRQASGEAPPRVEWSVAPIDGGLVLRARF